MKTVLLTLSISILTFSLSAQVLCVNCFQQNDSISTNVTNLISNGSFENTNCLFNSNNNTWCPNSTAHNCDIVDWLCLGGGINTYAAFWDSNYMFVQSGLHSPYFGNDFCNACSSNPNDTSCIGSNGCVVTGISTGYPYNSAMFGSGTGISLQQNVSGLIPGSLYALEFWAGGEGGGSFTAQGLFAVDVGFGNIFLRNNATIAMTGVGLRYVIQFIADSTQHTIRFTNWGHICNHCTELILDDVRLYSGKQLSSLVPDCTNRISEAAELNIKVFPNPVINLLRIETGKKELTDYRIYDSLGKLQGSGVQNVVDVKNLDSGIYYINVSLDNGIICRRTFVKE